MQFYRCGYEAVTGWGGWRAVVTTRGGTRFWVDLPAEGPPTFLQDYVTGGEVCTLQQLACCTALHFPLVAWFDADAAESKAWHLVSGFVRTGGTALSVCFVCIPPDAACNTWVVLVLPAVGADAIWKHKRQGPQVAPQDIGYNQVFEQVRWEAGVLLAPAC